MKAVWVYAEPVGGIMSPALLLELAGVGFDPASSEIMSGERFLEAIALRIRETVPSPVALRA